MKVPYALVMIKPLSVGRGFGPEILEKLLTHCPIALRMFRVWPICDTTLMALTVNKGPYPSTLVYEDEKIHPGRQVPSWICVFTHLDRQTDPIASLEKYCGPLDHHAWMPEHVRYQYGGYPHLGKTTHPSDTVVHIATPERVSYEANLLFMTFDETTI